MEKVCMEEAEGSSEDSFGCFESALHGYPAGQTVVYPPAFSDSL